MGCSCDWQRTRFTLDPVCARAVRHTFFSLFREGLIYRGKRLVNWDTLLQTAVSDDEVFHETVPGHFWYFHYPVIDPKPGEPRARDHRHHAARDDARRHGRGGSPRSGRRARRSRGRASRAAGRRAGEGESRRSRPNSTTSPSAARRSCRCWSTLRDMALDGRKRDAAAGRPRDSAGGRRLGQAGVGHRLREDHARPTTPNDYDVGQRCEPADGQHPQPRRHAQRERRAVRRARRCPARENVVADLDEARPAGRRSRTARSTWPTATGRRRRSSRC